LKKKELRELVNRIQNRKDSGFEVTDKIKVYLQKNDTLEEAVKGMWIINQKH
jgi:isoleucyl-tRNA synthetase